MQAPQLSVIMPMLNARPFVADALRSILDEREVALEVVIVDDGSTDGSREVASAMGDPRVRIIDGPRQGIAAAFNAGLEACRGEIITRCDADDSYPAERLSLQARWLAEHPDFGAVCGAFAAMNASGGRQVPFDMDAHGSEITDELRTGEIRTHFCTFAVRADVLRRVGGARLFFVVGEDLDLQLRLGEACRVWYLPDVAYVYRLHDASITHSMHTEEREFYERQARTLQIQRQSSEADAVKMGTAPEFTSNRKERSASASAHMQGLLVAASWSAFRDGQRKLALSNAFHAAITRPTALAGWRNFLVLLLKLPLPQSRKISPPRG